MLKVNQNDIEDSSKPRLRPIIPKRIKENNKAETCKYISQKVNNIKNVNKEPKISIITDNYLNGINLDVYHNKKENQKNKMIRLENINEGITFKYKNGYKYYFNVRSVNIFLLKEVQFNYDKKILISINIWNKSFKNNLNYLNIICHLLNTPKNHYTFVIEYPKGGESLYDIIKCLGLLEQKTIYFIISEIYKNILLLKTEENEITKEFQNIPFCICNLFLTINEELKINYYCHFIIKK